MHDDKIIKYTNRLSTSKYLDDKISALQQLKTLSQKNILSVAINSMAVIIESIEATNEWQIQKEILSRIFKSYNKNEFIDIIFQDEKSVDILLRHSANFNEILAILAKSNGCKLYEIIKENNLIGFIVNNVKDTLLYFRYIIFNYNKEIFCHEGMLDKLLEVIDSKNYKKCIEAMAMLLKNCIFNQTYFLELRWLDKIRKYDSMEIYISLLDKRNNNFLKIQKMLSVKEILNLDRPDFLLLIIYNNPKNLVSIENNGFNIYEIIKTFKSQDCFFLLEEITKFKIIDVHKFNDQSETYFLLMSICYLQSYYEIEVIIKNEAWQNNFLFNLYRIKEMSCIERISFIIFFVLIGKHLYIQTNLLVVIKEFLIDPKNNEFEKALLFLLISEKYSNNDVLDYNEESIINYLIKLRASLCMDEFLITPKLKEYFLNQIQDKLIYYYDANFYAEYERCKIEREKHENESFRSVKLKTEEKQNVKTVEEEIITEQKVEIIKAGSYRDKITGFFSRIKIERKEEKSEKAKDTFDL
ncbi:hypothetical protein COBT_001687 [Conglomerata obtusa]